MNASNDNPSTIDQRQFDLLVDGELSEPERRRLLTSLDDTPDGWRRCALAFLEAQCLYRELGPISCPRPDQSRAEKRFGDGAATGTRWRTFVAMAASFLVALGLGISWRNFFDGDRDFVRPPAEVAEFAPPVHPAALDAAGDSAESSDSWRMVSFPVSNGADEVEMVRLPAVERDSIDEAWLMNLPRSMPAEVVREIENSGHRVRAQRRLLPFRMKDGRRLIVPVDQVEVQYVGTPAYH